MIYTHTHKGKILEVLDINEDTLNDHIIKYETPPEFNKGKYKNYTLHFELSLMHYLWTIKNFRYPLIEPLLIWDVISEQGINVPNYWKYFKSCLENQERKYGVNFSNLKDEL